MRVKSPLQEEAVVWAVLIGMRENQEICWGITCERVADF